MTTVTEYLTRRHVDHQRIHHAATQTARDEAKALHVAPGLVAKTILLHGPYGYALAVIPASERLDVHRAAEAMGVKVARLATEHEIRAVFPGYELAALPPLASLVGLPTFVDPELAGHEHVAFASGRQTESVLMRTADLLEDPRAKLAPLCLRRPLYDRDWIE